VEVQELFVAGEGEGSEELKKWAEKLLGADNFILYSPIARLNNRRVSSRCYPNQGTSCSSPGAQVTSCSS
jgi:hypothetical protein